MPTQTLSPEMEAKVKYFESLDAEPDPEPPAWYCNYCGGQVYIRKGAGSIPTTCRWCYGAVQEYMDRRKITTLDDETARAVCRDYWGDRRTVL